MAHREQQIGSPASGNPEHEADADLADDFRTQSFHLMQAHPIAAAHLVLAAASIAPTCAAEREVADEFSYMIADFAQHLRRIHQRAMRRRAQGAGSASRGH